MTLSLLAMPAIETPCINVCTLDPVRRICLGCGRTPGEIERWLILTPDERRAAMALARQRLAQRTSPSTPIA